MSNRIAAAALGRRRTLANVALACAVLACCVLIAFPPARFAMYPPCPIHDYFGIFCPGCGVTRALASLLRGHLLDALRLNALFVLLLPPALGVAINTYLRAVCAGEFRWPRIPTPAVAAMLFLAAAFTLARNLPH
jgi:hypothetical protein